MRQRTGGNSISPARSSISSRPRHTTSRNAPLACFQPSASHNSRDSFQRLLWGCSRMNSLESNLLTVDRLTAIAPRFRFRHNRSMPEMKAERSLLLEVFSTYFSPHWSGFCLRVARRQQQLRLMRLEHTRGLFAARPPHESPLRQPFLRQPKPLAVIDQDADRGPTPTP